MPLREGAAAGILARQPDRVALEQQRPEGQRLAERPVDALAGLDRLAPPFDEAGQLAAEAEAVRHIAQPAADPLQLVDVDGGLAAAGVAGCALDARPLALAPRSVEQPADIQSLMRNSYAGIRLKKT